MSQSINQHSAVSWKIRKSSTMVLQLSSGFFYQSRFAIHSIILLLNFSSWSVWLPLLVVRASGAVPTPNPFLSLWLACSLICKSILSRAFRGQARLSALFLLWTRCSSFCLRFSFHHTNNGCLFFFVPPAIAFVLDTSPFILKSRHCTTPSKNKDMNRN